MLCIWTMKETEMLRYSTDTINDTTRESRTFHPLSYLPPTHRIRYPTRGVVLCRSACARILSETAFCVFLSFLLPTYGMIELFAPWPVIE